MPWTKLQADAVRWEHYSPLLENGRRLTYREAIREALSQALEMHNILLLPQQSPSLLVLVAMQDLDML